jgi:hypothetical protein
MSKRSYNRRSDEELINDLQDKIRRVEARMQAKDRADAPVLKEVTKVHRTLKKFAQLATDHGRGDLSNMTMAFLSGLDRAAHEMPPKSNGKARPRREGASA